MIEYARCRAILARMKRRRPQADDGRGYFNGTLEDFMSLGLGSGINGETLSQVPCASLASWTFSSCSNVGVLVCSRCKLVKYCSIHCQRRHRRLHQRDCEQDLLDLCWKPGWIREKRKPLFPNTNRVQSEFPAFDCLGLSQEDMEEATSLNFKLCFVASRDIRHLIRTINSLPKNYQGKCEILINGTDAVSVNKNLLILYALLSVGPSIEESAELATHLMYSTALTPASAAYLRGCIRIIYGDGISEGNMSFVSSLKTRGPGMLCSMQSTMEMKQPVAMFLSRYELQKGLKSMRDVISDPLRADERDQHLSNLKPAHRVVLTRFRQTGVLAPFPLDTRSFNQPNRLMFTPNGDWLGDVCANPLREWGLSDIQVSGEKHGLETADIMGCLFFHVKRELMEFARRMKEFHVDLYLTQFDPRLLAKGISIGVFPTFTEACFDRVETSDLADHSGVQELLATWGPMLNRSNHQSCILMRSKHRCQDQPSAISQSRAHSTEFEASRNMGTKLHNVFEQSAKPTDTLNPYGSHESAFEERLDVRQGMRFGLRVRSCNRIYPKRFGGSMDASDGDLPDHSPDEYYNLFVLGGLDAALRFFEVEIAS